MNLSIICCHFYFRKWFWKICHGRWQLLKTMFRKLKRPGRIWIQLRRCTQKQNYNSSCRNILITLLQNIKNRDKLKTESDAAKRRAEDLNTLLCQTIKTPLIGGDHSKHYSSSLDIDRLLLGIAKTRSFIICLTKHAFMPAKPYEINIISNVLLAQQHLKTEDCTMQ